MKAASKYFLSIIGGKLKGLDEADLFMIVVILSDTKLMPLLLITSPVSQEPALLWIRWDSDSALSWNAGRPQRSDRARIPPQRGIIRHNIRHNTGETPNIFWCHDTDLVRRNTTMYTRARPNTFLTLTPFHLNHTNTLACQPYGGRLDRWDSPSVTFYTLCKEFFVASYLTRPRQVRFSDQLHEFESHTN